MSISTVKCNSCVSGQAEYKCSTCKKFYCILCSETEGADSECRRCLIFEQPGIPLIQEVLETLTIFDLKWYLTKQHVSFENHLGKQEMINLIMEKVGIQPKILNPRQVVKTKCNSCELELLPNDEYYCYTCYNPYCIGCVQINNLEEICTCKRCMVFGQMPPETFELDMLTIKDLKWFLIEQEIEFDFNLGKQGLIHLISRQLNQSLEEMRLYEPLQEQSQERVYLNPNIHRIGGDSTRRRFHDLHSNNYRPHNKKRFDKPKSKEDKDNYCRICMDSPINCALVECGHMLTCIDCGERLRECPLCRRPVDRLLRVYSST